MRSAHFLIRGHYYFPANTNRLNRQFLFLQQVVAYPVLPGESPHTLLLKYLKIPLWRNLQLLSDKMFNEDLIKTSLTSLNVCAVVALPIDEAGHCQNVRIEIFLSLRSLSTVGRVEYA